MSSIHEAVVGPMSDAQRRAVELLRRADRFLLTGHERPDGDCIGAQAALAAVLAALGKEVAILNPDAPGERFDDLVAASPFGVYSGGELPGHDVCVLLDFNTLSRTGGMAEPIAAAPSRKVVIDHHPFEGEPWWDEAFVDESSAATGILVHRIARFLGVRPDPVFCRAVFTSIVTDTGWFRYSNTDTETLAVAAELVSLGVDPSEIHRRIYQREAPAEPGAIAMLLGRLEYFCDGRLVVVDQPVANDGRPEVRESDTVLDILRSVESVEVVLFLREHGDGTCKLSARSKTGYDVNALARRFGGGGHAKAAGATIPGTLSDVRARLIEAVGEGFAGR